MATPVKTPNALKLAAGNPGKRPKSHFESEPKPAQGAPTPPTTLKGESLAEWRRIVPALDEIGMLSKVDRAALVCYCLAWAEFVDCQRVIKKDGAEHTLPNGVVCLSRTYQRMERARKAILDFGRQFGLVPAARAGLGAVIGDAKQKAKDDPELRFFG